MINKNDKIKIFTHNDLDGISCKILFEHVFKNADIVVCSVANVNDKIKDFIMGGDIELYKHVIITDLSIDDDVEKLLNSINIKKMLLDHHKTALYLNRNYWATIITENIEGTKQSAASLVLHFLIETKLIDENINNIIKFVEYSRLYDTWEWKQEETDIPLKLNNLLYYIGEEDFTKYFLSEFKKEKEFKILCEKHKELLIYYEKEKEKYIESKMNKLRIYINKETSIIKFIKNIFRTDNALYITVLCDRNDCISFLGDRILTEHNVDYVKIIYDGGVSLRSKGNFDVSVIAKKNGGGGHKNASGYKCKKYWKHLI